MSDKSVIVFTVAGSLQDGHRDGAGKDALFYNPLGLAFTNSGDIIAVLELRFQRFADIFSRSQPLPF